MKKFFRRALIKISKNQKGFTLLELLVVVAILAAIAGTATIALQDTDARASAAAHVAMMDELNKGVRTYRVLNHNSLPNNFDSLMSYDGTNYELLPNEDGDILGIGDVNAGAMILDANGVLADIGITELRYIDDDGTVDLPDDVTSCAVEDLQDVISDRGNAVVAGNIFNGSAGNGCGISITLSGSTDIAYWTGAIERILGPGEYVDAVFDPSTSTVTSTDTPSDGAVAPVFMAVGFGPSCSLFNTQELGGLTSVPVYRHVDPNQYNRFIGLFTVAQSTYSGGAWGTVEAVDQVAFVAVVDGAGDTKEEELGEWDGTRNTI